MKYFFYGSFLLSLAIVSLFLDSCSDQKERFEVEFTCVDGIMNGGETGVDCGGPCAPCSLANGIEGVIVDRLVLQEYDEYILTGPLLIRDKAVLEIHEGTVIKAEKGKNAHIAVALGGKIYVWGNAQNPIVMTSNAENPAAGDWGGIVICGRAPTNMGALARSELLDLFYGGAEINDSSGVIKYLRVEYTGETSEDSMNFNGISLFGVGAYTTFEYVQSYEGLGNGFKILGGTVNPKWLVATNSGENSMSITEGWNGIGDYWYLSGSLSAGIQISNNQFDHSAIPVSTGIINNVSIIGPESEGSIKYTAGGGIFDIQDFYTTELNLGINVNDATSTSMIDAGNLNIKNILFDNPVDGFLKTNYAGSNNSFYIEGNTLGAEKGADVPSWAIEWAIGF